ncbi:MAG: cell division protein ZapA [Xanthomonadales bacterium]|nr:cell division protein ZapA [Gammaproteobacteria bacterium]MBT8073248.1 cell division protein ZapA [Gammaproteobacteria bacterium]MBT8075856.1 cell division protein ZapA [Gammaproteobacteria bacterium]NNK04092.1 cell division protein ZapA [Xanthomonadales bacterium]NNK98286.1 cell division protein ZapA [Xanthomonadales bacterium]
MEKTSSEPISVSILDRDYQFACEPGERKALREAAAFLDERMRSIKGAGRLMALERIAVMTALNLSDELLKLQKNEKYRQDNVDNRIRMLVNELDDALDDQLS